MITSSEVHCKDNLYPATSFSISLSGCFLLSIRFMIYKNTTMQIMLTASEMTPFIVIAAVTNPAMDANAAKAA